IDGVAIGAMEPVHMLERIGPGTLVIVPGDREDAILRLTAAHSAGTGVALGLVLTGGYRPSQTVIDEIRWADLFATLVAEDTYEVASEVHDLLVKTHPADAEKIALIKALVAERLDVERILAVAR
ncbi:MAG TPA: DRTGG domain-containing protein, partial [Patescibacteria group bacterium]|nr:DRTGG domain-containing protein [Patescibacteria group bacterium]